MATLLSDAVTAASNLADRERAIIRSYRGETPMLPEPDKIAALLDCVRTLDAEGIPYALIGGLAVGVHSGSPRATLDIDLAAATSCDRRTIVAALERVGFRQTGQFEHSVNFRHSSGEPLQVAFDPEFDPMIERAERFDMQGISIAIVRKDDLIAMKERAGADPARRKSKRLRDQADAELLRGDVPDPDEGW